MLNKKFILIPGFLLLLFIAVSGDFVSAQTVNAPGIDLTPHLIFERIYTFACWFWSTTLVALIIFVVISGLRIMYAGSNATQVESAKSSFKYIILGSIIVIGTFIIIATVAYNVGADISYIPFDCQASF